MKPLRNLVVIIICICSLQILQAQTQLNGTWYTNGRANQPSTITQNGLNLVFSKNNNNSSGYFTNTTTVFAKEWNTAGLILGNGHGILWVNQIWTRSPYSGYPSLIGNWTVGGQGQYTIEQDNMFLTITYQGKKSVGYFTTASAVIVPEWSNATANLSTDGNTLTWNNQVWTKTSASTTVVNAGSTQKLCRAELSSFYFASQSLGTVWGRAATEPGRLSADAIGACTAALSILDLTLANITCIVFDRGRITALRNILSTATSQQVIQQTENLIRDLQAVVQNLRMSCDNNVNLLALYVGGVHLGAAQAWASSRQCQAVPMPAAIQTVILNHLNTADAGLQPYSRCIPNFDFTGFGRVVVNSMNSIVAHTQIAGIETQLLWAIALSNCCCTCSPGQAINTGTTTSECDSECDRYCKSLGKQSGKFNGRTPCILGVVSGGVNNGCDCY